MTSVLRRLPRDSSRTRAVAEDGTSSTTSSRATSHCARCRPRPRAFSTAQRRSGNCLDQRIDRDSRPTMHRSAAELAVVFVAGSTALAVCDILWGSIPMIIAARSCSHRGLGKQRSACRLSDPQCGTSPLLSRPPPAVDREANPGKANPKAAGASRANPTNDLPDATNLNPPRPAPHIQVGASVSDPFVEVRLELVRRDCQTIGVTGLAVHVGCWDRRPQKRRPSKVMAKALRAGFQRFIHRSWPVPVGSSERTTM